MKRRHPLCGPGPISMLAITALLLFCWPNHGNAAKFKSAEVTRVVNDVNILTGTKTSRPASKGAKISGSTALRTGLKSRAELQFPDKSIVRLGSNSVFSFLQGKREVDLEKGTLLLQVPKSLGRTRVKTAAVSAAITGTTILVEYVPPAFGKAGTVKIIVIEGSLELSLNAAPRKKLKLGPGEMVAFRSDAKQLPQKFQIDIGKLVKTSLLIDGGMGQLPFLRPIEVEELAQNDRKRGGQLLYKDSRRQQRGRIFSRIFSSGNPQKRSVTIFGRPRTPPTPPTTGGGGGNNGGGGSGPTAPAGGGGITLPDRPDRDPPGGGPSNP